MEALETDRLLIRQLNTNDAAFILELLNSPTWLQYIGDRGVRTEEGARNYIQNGPMLSYEQNGFGLWLVQLKEDSTPIGICGLIKRAELEDVDIGFAMLPEYAGKGYTTEAAMAVMSYGTYVCGLRRVVAITTTYNQQSVNVLKKLGMEYEKMVQLQGDGEQLMLYGTPRQV